MLGLFGSQKALEMLEALESTAIDTAALFLNIYWRILWKDKNHWKDVNSNGLGTDTKVQL